jgi:hypothetical protein
MTKEPKPKSQIFRFLFIGGWTGVKNATIGSVLAVFVTLTILKIYVVGQNGLQVFELTTLNFQPLLPAVAFILLVAILLSAVPAFISGVFLAWWLNQKNSKISISNQRKISFGALVGASAGVVLTLLILIPADFVERTAHSGYGYNFLNYLPIYLFYAVEFIAISTIAGIWTDRQLRKYLENTNSTNTGQQSVS